MNRKNKSGFDDVAGMAASAFEMLGGAQGKIKDLVQKGAERLAGQMDLATREETEDLYEMISAARLAQQQIEQRLSAIEAQLGIGQARSRTASTARKPAAGKPASGKPAAARSAGATASRSRASSSRTPAKTRGR